MITASPPLIIKSVEIATGRQPFFGTILKLRPNVVSIHRFERRGVELPVTKSSRSEIQLPSTKQSKLDANVRQVSPEKLEAMEEDVEKGCTYVVSSFTDYFADGCKGVLSLVEAIGMTEMVRNQNCQLAKDQNWACDSDASSDWTS